MSDSGKKLCELRVCDLKEELEKRKLETCGAKATLVERLEQAIKSEGLDSSKYIFELNSKVVRNAMDSKKMEIKPVEEIKIKEEPIDDEEIDLKVVDAGEERSYNDNEQFENDEEDEVDQVGDVDDECVIIEDEVRTEVDNINDEEGSGSNNGPDREEENTGESNEESINLTIGEDEQKLLHDEAPDDKEKCTDAEGDTSGRSSAQKSIKPVAALKDTRETKGGSDSSKDGRKCSKSDDDKSKRKDEKSSEKKDKETSEQKSSSNKISQKDDKEKSSATISTKSSSTGKQTTPSRNLWVSGLSSLTRASDLKTIFSKYGKVIGAKVVTNTRTPGTRCYGYVTMSSSSDASRCIEHLHHTELHGRIISVERTKNEIGSSSTSVTKSRADTGKKDEDKKIRETTSKTREDKRKPVDTKKDDASKKPEVENHKQRDKEKEKDHNKKDEKDKEKDKDKEKSVTSNHEKRAISKDGLKDRNVRQHSNRSRSNDRNRNDRNIRDQRQRDREREQRLRQREYIQLREERERQRLRERERELREEERRRREIRERQRQEEARLAEERRKLAQERERLEKEKAELLRLERERQKLEREKIELERLELKRQQMKIMHAREDPIKRLAKRPSDERYTEVSNRKRSSGSDSRFEAPPPPRFDTSLITSSRSYDKKREDYNGSSSSKRTIDDFSSSSKRMDYTKRDDFSSAGTKRSALDDYPVVPTKRNAEDYGKRSSEYLSSTSSKRIIDDYGTSKSSRDDYKREVEIRHVPTAGNNNSSSFHTNRDVSSTIHKASAGRYLDTERPTSGYRRGGIDDIRSSTSGNKRYENSNTYGSSNNGSSVWASSTHLSGSSSGGGGVKSYIGNGISNMHSNTTWQKTVEENNWRPMQSTQDRFDRTYNERSNSGYTAGGMFGSGGRYSGQMSRY